MSDQLFQFAGRLHPMVLHLPIGLFAALVLMELWWKVRAKEPDMALRRVMAWAVALSAGATAGAGWLLAEEPQFASDSLFLHRWLGVALASVLALMACFSFAKRGGRAYGMLVLASAALMVPAGHFGASMTHGPDFLFAPFASKEPVPEPTPETSTPEVLPPENPSASQPEVASPEGDPALKPVSFKVDIEPMLAQYCNACHGVTKRKGGLALHTIDDILLGGRGGPVVVAGKPEESELFTRMVLPLMDEDHMPKRDKPQPIESEIELFRRWIAEGAHFEPTAKDGTRAVEPAPVPIAKVAPAQVNPAAPALPAETIAALQARLVHVEVIDPATNGLWINVSPAPPKTDAELAAMLKPLAPFVVELGLARCPVGTETAAVVGAMPRLERLGLSDVALTPEVFHAAVASKSLKWTSVWGSGLADEVVDAARAEFAGRLTIASKHEGALSESLSEPLEVEPPVAFKKAVAQAAAAAPLEPINALCPVSGTAIDPKFAVLHEGCIVAFCCEKCALEFWNDPAKFAIKAK